MARLLFLLLAFGLLGAPAWGDPPPLTPADVREIHAVGDLERLYAIVRVQPRYQSSDAINRYRVNRLTPAFAARLEELLDGTTAVPGLTPWVRDFQDALIPIAKGSYDWPTLTRQVNDLHARYDALKIPAS